MSHKPASIVIYSDGSSRGNPGPGGYGSIAVYPDSHGRIKVDEFGGKEALTTNNRMEMMALLKALESFVDYYQENDIKKTCIIHTDSGYLINGITTWIKGWKRNNWITQGKEDVKNADIWKSIDEVLIKLKSNGFAFEWRQVPGHAGVPGNERCDVIATSFADGNPEDLYSGFAEDYSHQDVLVLISEQEIKTFKDNKKSASGKSKSAIAYSYVSMVDGQIFKDQTWAECEKRVKGTSKAKFKKSFSKSNEDEIVSEFLKIG